MADNIDRDIDEVMSGASAELVAPEPVEERVATLVGLKGISIGDTEDLKRYAHMLIGSGIVPRAYCESDGRPKFALVCQALETAISLGIEKSRALNSLFPVNNMLTLYGDALPALVQARGVAAYVRESYEGDPGTDSYTATCECRRQDSDWTSYEEFSVADAKRAGLWGKSGPWSKYPKRMLRMRARAWAFRAAFADVLGGVGVYEEQVDIREAETRPAFDPAKTKTSHVLEMLGEPAGESDVTAQDLEDAGLIGGSK